MKSMMFVVAAMLSVACGEGFQVEGQTDAGLELDSGRAALDSGGTLPTNPCPPGQHPYWTGKDTFICG